jgi:thermitase
VDPTHPDLAAQLVPGYNFYDNNTDTHDVFHHGTMVAGVAAAIGNNGVGVAGVAMNSKIMPIRVSDVNGYAYWSTLSSGLTYAADHGARVANMSYQAHLSSSVASAAQYMQSKGGLAVNSAGNTGALDSTPASDSLVTVAATDSNDARASFSSYGPYVDLSGPGVSVYTTNLGGGYAYVSGTSFSSPTTAGVVALMMAANPALTPMQITNLLKSTAVDLGDTGWDQYYGAGRVNAAAAVQAARNSVPTDTQAPTVSFSGLASGSVIKGIASINVNASDNVAVSKVELYAGSTLIGSDSTSPYAFSLDTTTIPDGNLALTAKAYDQAGNAASASITVSVRNTSDSTAPVVNILSPSAGTVLKGNVSIQASASDNVGVISMTLYVDGVAKASSSSGSINYTLNSRKLASGAHTIRVDAKDATGNVGTSSIQVSK